MIIRKIMLLGEMAVGKTSIVNRLVFDRFDADYKSTIGTDIYRYDIDPPPSDEPFQFLVWDVDGSYGESFFHTIYVREAHAALIVGDVTRPKTLETAAGLCSTFASMLPGRYCACVVNKIDLLSEPPLEEGPPPQLASLTQPIAYSSAKSGHNVETLFREAADAIVRRGI